jgi:HEAT repeat protein
MHCRNSQTKVIYQVSPLNVTDVLLAEFRESIRPAIPEIFSFLGDSELNVRKAGADALAKFSEQGKVSIISDLNVTDVPLAEFLESIRPTIPEIISLLRDSELAVRKAGAGALAKLSEQGKVSFLI